MRSVSWLSCYGGYRAGAGNPLGQGDSGGRMGDELEGTRMGTADICGSLPRLGEF